LLPKGIIENFPDKNFKNWLLAQDYREDRVITDEEIAEKKTINVDSMSIKNLKGIEYFTKLDFFASLQQST